MVFNSFKELAELVKQMPQKTKVAVVAAEDEHTLQAIAHAVEERLVEAVLIGKETKIAEILEKTGEKKENYEIVSAADPEESLQVAVKLVNDGICGAIMKGKLETGQLLKAILKKENNLRKGGLISLIGFFECPNYHKMFAVSDVAMNTYPDSAKCSGRASQRGGGESQSGDTLRSRKIQSENAGNRRRGGVKRRERKGNYYRMYGRRTDFA